MNFRPTATLTLFVLVVFELNAQIHPLQTNGSAELLSEECLQMTQADSSMSASSFWSKVAIDLDNSFDIQVALNFGCDPQSGEGIAFVIHNDSRGLGAIGGSGLYMGYSGGNGVKGIDNALVIEVDTRNNGPKVGDIAQDHIAMLFQNAEKSQVIAPAQRASNSYHVRDCKFHHLRISWQPSKLEFKVWFDDVLKISIMKDIRYEFFKNAEKVWFGFTSANGLKPTSQTVCINYITLEIDKTVKSKRAFQKEVFVYPNDEEDKVVVDFELKKATDVSVNIYDSNGNIVRKTSETNLTNKDIELNISDLPSGVYYLNITDGTRQLNKKLVHIKKVRA